MRAALSYWLIILKVIECEKSFLVIWNVSRLFVNTLTADDKYSLISKDNSMQTIQRHFSQKQNIFFAFFSCIFQVCIKFPKFSNKDDPHSLCI